MLLMQELRHTKNHRGKWTPDEVRKGMNNLKENIEMKSLQDAGISRQWNGFL